MKRRRTAASYRGVRARKRQQTTRAATQRVAQTVYVGRGELKFLDTLQTSNTIQATGEITSTSLNLIDAGTGESERIGRSVILKSIHGKGFIRLPETMTTSEFADQYRIIVYQDKQANGAAATVAQILQSTDIQSFRNLENTMRFHIMYDKTKTINATASLSTESGRQLHKVKINITCQIPLEFSGTGGGIADLRSNNVGVLMITEAGLAVSQMQWRVRYTDR